MVNFEALFKKSTFLAVFFLIVRSSAVDEPGFHAALSKAGIQGSIVNQGDAAYILDALPWNLLYQPKPLSIVYANSTEDVSRAVSVAASYGVPVQPRSGGHSFGSYSLGGTDGALVVDLKALNTVNVNQTTWLATIGGGTSLDLVTSGLYNQGQRAIAHGTCPTVGIGGHATIGGQGPLSRMYGLTLDHVVEVEVVISNGTIINASQSENADLFWVSHNCQTQPVS
jgi:FAD/FMN-containing dehydrogenase